MFIVVLYIIVFLAALTGCDFGIADKNAQEREQFSQIISLYSEFELRVRNLSEHELEELYDLDTMTIFDEEVVEKAVFFEYRNLLLSGHEIRPIVYALHDINKDGVDELLISIDGYDSLFGIYALKSGEPVSIIQAEHRHNLRLLLGVGGNAIIHHSWGHMAVGEDFFYKLDERVNLVLLDKLYTNGHIIDEYGEFVRYIRAKNIDGKATDITEEEFLHYIRKYGAQGFAYTEGREHARIVEFEWNFTGTPNGWAEREKFYEIARRIFR